MSLKKEKETGIRSFIYQRQRNIISLTLFLSKRSKFDLCYSLNLAIFWVQLLTSFVMIIELDMSISVHGFMV